METPGKEPITALEHIKVPEKIDIEAIRTEIGPSIDLAIERAAKIDVVITNEPELELALDTAEKIKEESIITLEKWREEFYMEPWYRRGEEIREIFDSRLRPARVIFKTIMKHVSNYELKKKRDADIARERAEAEARRAREEAERKQREFEDAERKAKEAKEAEERRVQEVKEAEERRIQAEKVAKERREREARELAAAETQHKLKEEEDARIKQAEVADEVGNGPEKVDIILENPTPISPVIAKPEQARDKESLRLEQEQAQRVADEKARREREALVEAEKKRLDAEAETKRKREEMENAATAATAAKAAAAATSIATKSSSRTQDSGRYKWVLDSDGTEKGDEDAIYALLQAALNTRGTANPVPLSFIGYDKKSPEKFRPSAIQTSVNDMRERFSCPGILAYLQTDSQLKPKRRKVGGRR